MVEQFKEELKFKADIAKKKKLIVSDQNNSDEDTYMYIDEEAANMAEVNIENVENWSSSQRGFCQAADCWREISCSESCKTATKSLNVENILGLKRTKKCSNQNLSFRSSVDCGSDVTIKLGPMMESWEHSEALVRRRSLYIYKGSGDPDQIQESGDHMKNTVLHSLVARGKRCCAVLSGDRATRLCHVSHRSYQVIIGMMTSGDVTTDVTPAEPGGENMIARGNMRTNTQLRPA